MATQYTSLLGLALPVTGELSGTWGDTVNDAITSLLDSAVAGTTTLNTDADVTLTTTTGAANQARQAIILWTANGTTTRNITAPAQSKIYTVINASAGTQSIVFRGVGPTAGVTVVKGESAVVAWNGSDFIKISNTGGGGSFTNVTISGTTTLSGLTASTALALNASKEVVSVTNTGTGDNVLATSPVLTTPNLGTPSAVTLTNATGLPVSTGISGLGTGVATALAVNTGTAGAFVVNGGALGTPSSGTVTNLTGTASININGTVGATTPTTGAFTTLTTSSTVTLNGGTANGVAYLNGSKVLTTGSALTFDGSNLTTVQSDGYNGLRVTNTSGKIRMSGYVNGTLGAYIDALNAAESAYTTLTLNGNPLVYQINGTEQMRLTSTGLGIGTSSPGAKLDVAGTAAISGAVTLSGGTANGVAYLNGSKVLTTGSALTFDGTALGINTTTPSNPGAGGFPITCDFQIYKATGNASTLLAADASNSVYAGQVYSSTANATILRGNRYRGTQASPTAVASGDPVTLVQANAYDGTSVRGITQIGSYVETFTGTNDVSGYMNFSVRGTGSGAALTEQMRLTSTGLGIGTSSPTSGYKLTLATGGISITGNQATAGVTGAIDTQAYYMGNSTYQYLNIFKANGLGGGAVSQLYGAYFQTATAASAYTTSEAAGVAVGTHIKGAGSTVTTAMGVDIADQTVGTNNYGLRSQISSGSNKYNIYANGTAQNYFEGSVGIGTSSPGDKLEVAGNARVRDTLVMQRSTSSAYLSVLNYGNTLGGAKTDNLSFGLVGSGDLLFWTNATERMRLDSSGNLGIGTSSPQNKLDVSGAGSTVAKITNTDSTGNTIAGLRLKSGSNYFGFYTSNTQNILSIYDYQAGADRVVIDSSGNLGLGVTPSAWVGNTAMQVGTLGAISSSSTSPVSISANAYATSAGWAAKYITSSYATLYQQASGAHYWYTAPSGTAGNAISFTQAMTLDASGNLLVGTTSATGKLTVAQSGTGTAADISTSNTSTTNVISVYRPNNGNMLSFNNNGSIVGSISVTTTTSYNTTSDQRLKHDIVDAPDASGLIDAIKVRSFKWNTDDSEQRYGFIAQELVTVAPEAVHQPEDPEEMMAVDYSKLVPMLVKEIQSLRARVAAIEAA